MKETPVDKTIVERIIKESGIPPIKKASIREIVNLVNQIEKETKTRFIHLEMGVPGLPASEVGVQAEIEALKKGVASIYPNIDGIPELKDEGSRFIKMFLDIDVEARGIIPSVGSMQGSMAAIMIANRCNKKKNRTLFIDPGFPVQKQQHQILGIKYESFDVYHYRGEKLREKIESYLQKGNISTIIYSNPNNPSWICFHNKELQIIGELATKYDVVVIEDLAYFAMDFRSDYSKPGVPPFQPSVAKYTDNYVLLVSSSKVFSYAGQRVGIIVIGNKLYSRNFPDLKRFYSSDKFGYVIVHGVIYALSAGTTHSSQFAMAAMLKAASDGTYNFVDSVKEYGERARQMKDLFIKNGFRIVYDMDEDLALADGFYFTVSYRNMIGPKLVETLLYYGISALPLSVTGSVHSDGLRVCVSQVTKENISDLQSKLEKFNANHS